MKRGHPEGQAPENNIDDGAALRCRFDPRRKSWEKGFILGRAVITETLYIDVKHDFFKKNIKKFFFIAVADLTAREPRTSLKFFNIKLSAAHNVCHFIFVADPHA